MPSTINLAVLYRDKLNEPRAGEAFSTSLRAGGSGFESTGGEEEEEEEEGRVPVRGRVHAHT